MVPSTQDLEFMIFVQKGEDGFVATPIGVPGVVVGQGDTAEAAIADARSALAFHFETFPELLAEYQRPELLTTVAVTLPQAA
jgi:predicted RNase H-like HicB family nuclease